MLTLTPSQRRTLRARAHHLQPTVMIGEAGLSASVMREIDISLKSHELIKIKISSDNRQLRDQMLDKICGELDAAAVQHIGKIIIVYRPKPTEEKPAEKTPSKKPKASDIKAKRSVRR